jgi:hypothetical protein
VRYIASATKLLLLLMAYEELQNFSVHAKFATWRESNFYEILGIPYEPTPSPTPGQGEYWFVYCYIQEAAARKLVDIPTVSANMDYYTRPAPQP